MVQPSVRAGSDGAGSDGASVTGELTALLFASVYLVRASGAEAAPTKMAIPHLKSTDLSRYGCLAVLVQGVK